MSGGDLFEYRLDRLEKSEEKKVDLLIDANKKIDKILQERALEKQREKWIIAILIFLGSFGMEYVKKYLGF